MPLIVTPTKPLPIFPSAMPPELMENIPLLLNPPSLEDMPPKPEWTSPAQVIMTWLPSPVMSIFLSFDLLPVKPLIPVPWNIHQWEYFSMEQLTEHLLEDPDSPMEDMLPIEPEPATYCLPDSPEDQTHTLFPEEPPIKPWQRLLMEPNSPVSHKHSLSPTSPSSIPIHQCTSREGSYQSITPAGLLPIASTLPQNQGNPLGSSEGSTDTTLSL